MQVEDHRGAIDYRQEVFCVGEQALADRGGARSILDPRVKGTQAGGVGPF